jgi:hypothetical protein
MLGTPRHTERFALLSSLVVTVMLALLVGPASAVSPGAISVYVDCAAAPGGDGKKKSPLPTITAAVPIARALAAEAKEVTIDVAPGICDHEVFPIQLDFPVVVRGSRTPEVDDEGLPLNGQDHDTLVTWVPPSPVPPSVANLAFVSVTGSDVRISKLSFDGKIVPGTPGTFAAAAIAPTAVLVINAQDFVLDQLRIVRMGVALRIQGAGGRIRDTYFGTIGDGLGLNGGNPTAPPTVIVTNNRIENYWTGAFTLGGAGPAGTSIQAVIEGNDTVTSYADTGPSNPFAVRIAPVLLPPFLQGTVNASFQGNRLRGTPRYAIIVNAGRPVRRADGQRYSGVLDLSFTDNAINESGVTRAVSLITFTNSRATELPCERDPANTPIQCPTLGGNPLQYWEYLEKSVFDLHHGGELDGALIDHPEIEPVDGRFLNNVLLINDEVAGHETFVVVP